MLGGDFNSCWSDISIKLPYFSNFTTVDIPTCIIYLYNRIHLLESITSEERQLLEKHDYILSENCDHILVQRSMNVKFINSSIYNKVDKGSIAALYHCLNNNGSDHYPVILELDILTS